MNEADAFALRTDAFLRSQDLDQQAKGTGPAPKLSAEDRALRQVLAEPHRDPNAIRDVYDLPRMTETQLAGWIGD